ncbi:hypothetical protein KMW28_15910 [Flammeovirga yaeyamensis]|uniref:DUF1735 domain-containing protein n=1 Tax=Flammeovirga yaeyamensis TaxID=367791 RepID=A0AAX1N4Q0_9BACT|nr:hypothetical protein [Flammeovirga yaeyamensis]MBB3698506.1 hypothetical protein [Flammeovirga yaeyamensis]NMF34145.1 hypothetical protein [Flammeovirga yaeyamensis]QWG01130.1 hypothetical protein KMW28_15910 [Flammeovirga yaeyamensis]
MKYLYLALITMFFYSCNDMVSKDKFYTGDPFVSLSGDQETLTLSKDTTKEIRVEHMDSISISTPIDKPLTVTLKVDSTSYGTVGVDYEVQTDVKIAAGSSYGYYKVTAKAIDPDEISKTNLILYIDQVDQPNIIPGLMGNKKNNEDRRPRLKTYLFKY